MAKGKASGIRLTSKDIPVLLGMVARGDRDHDIAAWFGVNQGRIAEAKEGKYGLPSAAPASALPPKGPPGVKGAHLREAVERALVVLASKGPAGVADTTTILTAARKQYDANET